MSLQRRWVRWGGAFVVVVMPVLGSAAVGCVGDDNAQPDAGTPDAGPFKSDATTPQPDGAQPDAGPGDTGTPQDVNLPDAFDAGPPLAHVRFAALTPHAGVAQPPQQVLSRVRAHAKNAIPVNIGSGIAFDVCVAPHGTTAFTGPLLTNAGLTGGLDTYDVSRYVDVVPGQYDVRVVPITAGDAGPTTCAAGPDAGADITNLPAIPAGATLTVAWVSSTTSPTGDVVVFNDETTTATGKGKVRFANVSQQATNADYGLSGGVAFVPLFKNVAPSTHLDPTADTNGYVDVDPFTNVDTTLQYAGSGQDQAVSDSRTLAAGDVTSVFGVDIAGDGTYYGLVVCRDGHVSSQDANLSDCTLTDGSSSPGSIYSGVRLANFIADTGFAVVDVCIKNHAVAKYPATPAGYGAAQVVVVNDGGLPPAPIPALPPSGVPQLSMTAYAYVHGGFTYDVRVVAGGSTDCSTALTPDGTMTTPGGSYTYSTLALYGQVTPPDGGTASFGMVSSEDSQGAVSPALFRWFDLALAFPGTMTVTTNAQTPVTLANALTFGSVGSYVAAPVPDGINVTVGTLNANLPVNGSSVSTVFAYTDENSQLQLLVCDDAQGLGFQPQTFWSCNQVTPNAP